MTILPVSYSDMAALDPSELIPPDELELRLEIEQALADAWRKKHPSKSIVGGKPWHIERRGDQYCVVLNAGNETVKCHPTRERALAHMRALYANEKYSPDQERDDHGRWTSDGEPPISESDRLMMSSGPMAGVNFRIGTMREEDQKIVRDGLDKLGSKYPSVVSLIKSVSAAPLTTRLGSMDDRGNMKFTNLASKDERYIDSTLDNTVAHEFGHALFRDMAGIEEPNERPPTINQFLDRGTPYREAVDTIQTYNATVREQESEVNSVVVDLYRQVSESFGGDGGKIYDQLVKEFTGNPQYVASSQQELLAEAFGHYQTGQHGVITDIVGKAIDEHYGVKSK